ncbi:MAG: hypothetical protein GXP62_21485 [Oligoflexia bacterium]|nr:hypothetical protein [Oligoflexia bacterium]
MAQVLEYSGRLTRSDKRPANPGRYDLVFGLHASSQDERPLWEETVRGVDVVPGGFFRVVLGRSTALTATIFDEGPRWLGVRVLRGRATETETAPRVPVAGLNLQLDARVSTLEGAFADHTSGSGGHGPASADPGGSPKGAAPDDQLTALSTALDELEQRLVSVETDLESTDIADQVGELTERLQGLDDEDAGRIIHIEDELEDLVGPDGDVVDLNERMDRIEGQAPRLIASLRAREAELSRERVGVLRVDLDQLTHQIGGLRKLLADLQLAFVDLSERPTPTAEDVGAVSRHGDAMTGGLTINRGGLEVLSGGVVCRGATVNSLEASNLLKAPKVIADALELRGDLTVDNTHRAVQVRLVEGRQGSSRRDGALFLNGRSGFEVVVGTADEARGMAVFGPVSAQSYQADQVGVAQSFDVYGSIAPGQVACMRPDGLKVEFSKTAADPAVVGVCVKTAALVAGGSTVGGRALVTLCGVAQVQAEAGTGIAVGDLLVSGPSGVARGAPGDAKAATVLGKALSPLDAGSGMVAVLVGAR